MGNYDGYYPLRREIFKILRGESLKFRRVRKCPRCKIVLYEESDLTYRCPICEKTYEMDFCKTRILKEVKYDGQEIPGEVA